MPLHFRKYWLAALLVATLVVAAIGVAYRTDLAAERERIAHASLIAQTPCGPIEYAVQGRGPPVLVVHGAGGGFDQGLLIGQDLVRNGYRVIAVSRFGYLGTPLPSDGSAAAQADAHACLLDALRIDRLPVMGASAGAPSAMQLAIRHPERVSAMILLVPAAYLPGAKGVGAQPPPGLEIIFNTALRWDFPFWAASHVARKTLIHRMLGTPPELLPTGSEAERVYVNAMLDAVLPVSLRREGLVNDGKITTAMPRYDLERVRAPTLIISARDDLYGTYERARYTASRIPGARFIGYTRGGHLLVGHADETREAILELLKTHSP